MSNKLRSWYNTTMISYLGLITTIIVWYFFVSPPQHKLELILSSLYLLVLFLPAPGLLKKSNRVFMWSSYLILIYFIHAVVETWANDEERIYALFELVLSCIFFVAATMCFRYSRQPEKSKGL